MSGGIRELIERFVDEVLNHRSEDAINALVSDGSQGYDVAWLRNGFPDFSVEAESIVAGRNEAAMSCNFVGTHTGWAFGRGPTGRKVSMNGAYVFELDAGKLAPTRVYWETEWLREQISRPTVTLGEWQTPYEVRGSGPPVVFNSGGTSGMVILGGFVDTMSKTCRVLAYDRPLCMDAEIVVQGDGIFEMWAENLHDMLQRFDMCPAYVGGGSGGAKTALRFAHRYPGDVRGLFIVETGTDQPQLWESIAAAFAENADVAQAGGMEAVLDRASFWLINWAYLVKRNVRNRDILLAMNPAEFAATMRKWSESVLKGNPWYAGLDDEQVRRIAAPTLVVAGPPEDPVHPRHTAVRLHELLPNSLLYIPEEEFGEAELTDYYSYRQSWGDGRMENALAPIMRGFVDQVESGGFEVSKS